MTDDNYLEEEQSTRQPPWFLLTGLVLGLAIGLVISLLISPAVNADALPHELDQAGKAVYREQIALAYTSNYDLSRAMSRLELLQDADPAAALIAQAQAVVAQGGPVELSRALAELGAAVQQLSAPTSP